LSAPNEPSFLQDDTVPEVEDNITDDGPRSEWNEGSYAGYDCLYREITDPLGETVVTKRGNKYARKGDYVVNGLDEAPMGYHSQTIARVIRADDNNLSLSRDSSKVKSSRSSSK
jgi:hypothetical protein